MTLKLLLLYLHSSLFFCPQYDAVRCSYWDIQNIEVSVSEWLICETLYGHAFETFDVGPNNRDGRFSGVQHEGIFCGCG